MKIAITQRQLTVRGITYDCLEQGWFGFLQGHELIPIPNIANIDVDADMIVFTGGAGLYGRGLASQLAATGAKLILADRYVAALEAATVGKPAR